MNGTPVAVINKSFELPGFLLQSGVNVATDANGNPIAGVDVTFTAENGRSRFVDTAGALHDTYRQATDIDGNAVMAFSIE